ncbi:MAG TPA: prepilin-type N-terminal cleavage/methylation domain-containing protein [Sedimentisphaerales bacterium]|nr:prepilin-type N-terminal cleavage/methylation domain-containing protein [Sedimentisphaerales bacterium]
MAGRLQKSARGFTVIEMLLSLAIAALLLAAVTAAFNASVVNYRENEDIFKSINKARQALFRITTQLRTAAAVAIDDPNNECSLLTADLKRVTYRFNSADNKLYLVTDDDLFDSDYVLCDNVADMTFTRNTFTEIEDVNGIPVSVTKVRSVQTSMTVQSGDVCKKVSAAAVVRRNLK